VVLGDLLFNFAMAISAQKKNRRVLVRAKKSLRQNVVSCSLSDLMTLRAEDISAHLFLLTIRAKIPLIVIADIEMTIATFAVIADTTVTDRITVPSRVVMLILFDLAQYAVKGLKA
jgi:hypothetical protein